MIGAQKSMDHSKFEGNPNGVNGYPNGNGDVSFGFVESLNYTGLYEYKDPPLEFNFVNPSSPPFGSFLNDFGPSGSVIDPRSALSPQFGAVLEDFSSSNSGTTVADVPLSPGLQVLLDGFGSSPSTESPAPPSPQVEDFLNDFISTPSAGASPEVHSPDDSEADPVLKYINQMLMEENMEEKHSMFTDPLALQAAEKPFYDALVHDYVPSPDQHPFIDQFVEESPDGVFSESIDGVFSGSTSSDHSSSTTSSGDPPALGGNQLPSVQTTLVDNSLRHSSFSEASVGAFGSLSSNRKGAMSGSHGMQMDPNFFSQRESMLLFQKGMEEASKFIPKAANLVVDLETMTFPDDAEPKGATKMTVKEEREESTDRSSGRRVHGREDSDLEEGRSSKQAAVSFDEAELSHMFDKVLLWHPTSCITNPYMPKGEGDCLNENEHSEDSDGADGYPKKHESERNVVDLRTQLILCAQATASDDRRTADELLKQIRQHSSPAGDGAQRLAHYFANALEARLAGTGSQIYTALAPKRISAAQIIKAFQVFLTTCPFKKMCIGFSILSIVMASEKAKTLHIIDFGILYGFQWPTLIQKLADRPGGPPKLRITGIELPQPGFRPLEQVEETGRRLQKYCDRFKVPFEYHPIAQKWETVKIKDLKIRSDEFVAVNCLYRFKNLLDETVVVDSPRNTVLNLIKKIKPDIFVHSIVNGCFNAPFFITRFREALFHYSTMFDMLDATINREQPERMMYERVFCGGEIMNVVACEGTERIERPETYKQWQTRIMKVGFKQLPLDPWTMEKLKWKVKEFYHKDFLIDSDGCWMLQGWKGRIAYASSAWAPLESSRAPVRWSFDC